MDKEREQEKGQWEVPEMTEIDVAEETRLDVAGATDGTDPGSEAAS